MQINETLGKMPALIARANEEAEGLRLEWQTEKEELRRLEAKTILMVKAQEPDMTVQEQKAKADDNEELYHKRLSVIKAESSYRSKCVKSKSYEDCFISARKLAELKLKEMQLLKTNVGG